MINAVSAIAVLKEHAQMMSCLEGGGVCEIVTVYNKEVGGNKKVCNITHFG